MTRLALALIVLASAATADTGPDPYAASCLPVLRASDPFSAEGRPAFDAIQSWNRSCDEVKMDFVFGRDEPPPLPQVPLPGAAILLIAGLGALAAIRRVK